MKCPQCRTEMKTVFVKYKRLQLEARLCPKCKEKIFTEDLTMEAIAKLEAMKLEKEYIKTPIRIGHSWGMTFKKDIAEAFNLNSKTKMRVHPFLEKGKIEIIF